MQLTRQNNGGIANPAFLLARKCNQLARTCIMNMRNATCVGTETSKVRTRVTLLFIFYSVVTVFANMGWHLFFWTCQSGTQSPTSSFLRMLRSHEQHVLFWRKRVVSHSCRVSCFRGTNRRNRRVQFFFDNQSVVAIIS